MNLRERLEARLSAALSAACGTEAEAMVAQAKHPEHGDYQVNGVMAAAGRTKRNPRQLATRTIEHCQLDDLVEHMEVAGPGFINLKLRDFVLIDKMLAPLSEPTPSPDTIVIDYSSPNLAKEMHVGHLRSTIIGDAMARVLEFVGHRVIRQNHVGDWGSQFGRLLVQLESEGANTSSLEDLEHFYALASKRYEEDESFASAARRRVVELQNGEASARAAWQKFIEISLSHCEVIYDRLGVTLKPEHLAPESGYSAMLPEVIDTIEATGLLQASQGARCVFSESLKSRDGKPLPLIVEKSDGGYLYATTDLAALRHRCITLGAHRVLYFVDARQSLHFELLFEVGRRCGLAGASSLEHHAFGLMLGTGGRPYRTRDGKTVKLSDLLDEAESRALELVAEKNPGMSAEQHKEIARVVGIGSVKYADLAKHRVSDYVFDWDRILSFEGNTAPYLLYAFTRTQRILEKAHGAASSLHAESFRSCRLEPSERDLALHLARFTETLESVASSAEPHRLCAYLYQLSSLLMKFYESSPVLKSKGEIRALRLLICERTAETLKQGLELLGLETLERM